MIKIPIESLNEFAIYDINLDSQFATYTNQINEYIKAHISTYLNFRIETFLNIVYLNAYFITLDSKCLYKPMCKILHIDYKELDENSMCSYYMSTYNNKISALKAIKTEAELQALFPELYEIYNRKLNQIAIATEIEYESKHIIPRQFYIHNKAKKMLKNNMNETDYQNALMEAPYFNLPYFINKVSYDLTNINNNLSNLLSILANHIIEIEKIQGIDANKVFEFVNTKNKELKRQA